MAKDGIYKDFKKKEVEEALLNACYRVQAPEWVFEMLDESIEDPLWDHMEEYNGCTLIEDPYHPCVECFIHDRLWRTGRGGLLADRIFYTTQVIFGASKFKAFRRFLGVRLGWLFYYKWKYIKQGLKTPYTQSMIEYDTRRDK